MPTQEPDNKLTAREKEVLTLAMEGKKSADIAAELYTSKRTVDFHLANIYRKLGVNSKIQAFNKANQLGLLTA